MELEDQSNRASIKNDAFWQQHYELMRASRLSRSIYCRQHGLDYDRFGYWLKKQKHQDESNLIPVRLKSEMVAASQTVICTLELKNGHSLKIHDAQALTVILDRYA
jgi:hypothetical protein